MLNKQKLTELFYYKEGVLYWASPTGKRIKKGDEVGSVNSAGYLVAKVLGKSYLVHRLIYQYHHGELPLIVDHKDNNPLNNAIENLRAATHAENRQNAKLRKDNKSGTKGVSFDAINKVWKVQVNCNNKAYRIGNFKDLELAELVSKMAREKLHGEFKRS